MVTDATAYESMLFLLERAKVLAGHFGTNDHVVLVLCGGNVSADDLGRYAGLFKVGDETRPA